MPGRLTGIRARLRRWRRPGERVLVNAPQTVGIAAPGGAIGRPARQSAAHERRAARRVTRQHARTFSVACRLLPARVRGDVYLLYSVLRGLDDLVDEGHPDGPERVAAVAAWAAGSDGGAHTPEGRRLAALAERHPIDRAVVADFCDGMRTDLARGGFSSEAELDLYSYRVAGTVGIIVGQLLGMPATPDACAAAAALGMAMQRTTILRDLDEDAAAGRCYVSAEAVRGRPDRARRRAVPSRAERHRPPARRPQRHSRRGGNVPRDSP